MPASIDQCPSCAARVGTPRPARCEFCGAALPPAPSPPPEPRPAPVLTTEQLDAKLARFGEGLGTRRRGFGSTLAFLVLLAMAVALAMMFLSVRTPDSPRPQDTPATPVRDR